MKIVIEDFFVYGSYQSSTREKGFYQRVFEKKREDIILTKAQDFDRQFRGFSDKSCPLLKSRRKIHIVYPLGVETGYKDNEKIVGSASQTIHVIGKVKVIAEEYDDPNSSVRLGVIAIIKGEVATRPYPGVTPTSANLEVKYSMDKIPRMEKSVSAIDSQSQSNAISGTAGVSMTGPNIGTGASTTRTTAASPNGTLAMYESESAWVPFNNSLIWDLIIQMQAENNKNLTLATTARSLLKSGVISFHILDMDAKKGTGMALTSPIYADDQTSFADPFSVLTAMPNGPESEADAETARRLAANAENGPRLRHIFQSGQDNPDDELKNSVLSFTGLKLKSRDHSHDKYNFYDTELRFLDQQNTERALGRAKVTDIVANGNKAIIFGLLREFNFDRRLKESSPFARMLEEQGGLFVIETDLIEISHRFTRNAVSRFPTYIELGFNQLYGNNLQSAYAYLDQDTGKESEWTEETEEEMIAA